MFVFLEAEDLEEFCSCFVIQEECVQLYMDRYKLILHDKQDTHDKGIFAVCDFKVVFWQSSKLVSFKFEGCFIKSSDLLCS